LAHLNLSRCPRLTNEGVSAVCTAPRLTTIDLSRNKAITDDAFTVLLNPIRRNLIHQEEVRSELNKVNGQLDYIIKGGEAADRVCIEIYRMKEAQLTAQLEKLQEVEVQTLALSVLQSVDLSFCMSITDQAVRDITRLPMISSLFLEHCPHVTDISASAASR